MIFEHDEIIRLTARRDAIHDFTRIFLMLNPMDEATAAYRQAHDLWWRMERRKAGLDTSPLADDKRTDSGR